MEVTVERSNAKEWRLYVTVPIAHSLVQRLTPNATLFWVHDKQWAFDRFVQRGSGPYLLGQWPGLSKFASISAADLMATSEWSKPALVKALGLSGYSIADSADPMFVVGLRAAPDLIARMRPRIPLVYRIAAAADAAGGNAPSHLEVPTTDLIKHLKWRTAPNFQENTVRHTSLSVSRSLCGVWSDTSLSAARQVPGFTSGGHCEVLIDTIEVDAKDLTDLAMRGVRVVQAPDK
jgi:hypothetical protein